MAKDEDNWFSRLKGGRLEVSLRGQSQTDPPVPLKLRASGNEDLVWRMVEFFEEVTGKEVVGDWHRPLRTGARPMAGQLSITEALDA